VIRRVDLDGYPADELVGYCAEVGADLLVMGTRGRGRLTSTFLGSTSLRALERAKCVVLIAKSPNRESPADLHEIE
jgi:nucleotide-binding universal stress UspA family protein